MKRDTRYGDKFDEALERFIDWAQFLRIPAGDAFELAAKIFADDHFGIESVNCADESMLYLNTGDTHSTTLILEGDTLTVSTWGDWHESTEQSHCEETNTIRCGYCGEFTPNDCDDWRNVVCTSCNHNVSNGQPA